MEASPLRRRVTTCRPLLLVATSLYNEASSTPAQSLSPFRRSSNRARSPLSKKSLSRSIARIASQRAICQQAPHNCYKGVYHRQPQSKSSTNKRSLVKMTSPRTTTRLGVDPQRLRPPSTSRAGASRGCDRRIQRVDALTASIKSSSNRVRSPSTPTMPFSQPARSFCPNR